MPDYQPTRKRSNQQTLHRGHPKRLHTAGDVAPKELHDAIVRAKPDYQPTRKRGNQQTLHSGHSRLHRAGDTTPKELHDAIEHALHERLRTAVKAICDASPVPRALFEKAFLASTPCAGLIEDSIALNMALKELHWAIDEILDDRLQTKVKQVCDESPESRALFEEALLTEATPSKPATRTSGRKKRARFVVCLQCKEDFDVSQKEDKTVCQFHPGMSRNPSS